LVFCPESHYAVAYDNHSIVRLTTNLKLFYLELFS
jgi:hypothetical protein